MFSGFNIGTLREAFSCSRENGFVTTYHHRTPTHVATVFRCTCSHCDNRYCSGVTAEHRARVAQAHAYLAGVKYHVAHMVLTEQDREDILRETEPMVSAANSEHGWNDLFLRRDAVGRTKKSHHRQSLTCRDGGT